MVNIQDCPGLIYGKPALRNRVPQEYRVLASHPRLSPADVQALANIPNGFSWNQSQQRRHSPCFAYVRLNHRDVVVRFLDIGFDDQDRPHCLRMEAALLEDAVDLCDDDKTIASLLSVTAWPEAPVEIEQDPVIAFRPAEPDPALLAVLIALRRGGELSSICIGDASSFKASAFGMIYDTVSHQALQPSLYVPITKAQPEFPHQVEPASPGITPAEPVRPRPGNSGGVRAFFVGLLVGAVVVIAPLLWYIHRQDTQLVDLSSRLEEHIQIISDLRDDLDKLQRDKETIEAVLAKEQATTVALQVSLDKWINAVRTIRISRPEQLEEQIKELRANPTEFIRRENERLRQENADLKKAQEVIRRALDGPRVDQP